MDFSKKFQMGSDAAANNKLVQKITEFRAAFNSAPMRAAVKEVAKQKAAAGRGLTKLTLPEGAAWRRIQSLNMEGGLIEFDSPAQVGQVLRADTNLPSEATANILSEVNRRVAVVNALPGISLSPVPALIRMRLIKEDNGQYTFSWNVVPDVAKIPESEHLHVIDAFAAEFDKHNLSKIFEA